MKAKPKSKPATKAVTATRDALAAQLYEVNPPRPATIIINRYMLHIQKMEQRISILEKQVKLLAAYNAANARLTAKLVNDLKRSNTIRPKPLPDLRKFFKV